MRTYLQITAELYTEHVVPVITAKQGDTGRGALVTLTDNGSVVVPDPGETLTLYAKKPDGTVSYLPGTLSGSAVEVDFTNTLLADTGLVECEIQVGAGADMVSTPVFLMRVLPTNFDPDAIISSDEFTALDAALDTLQTYDTRLIDIETLTAGYGDSVDYDVANDLTTAASGSMVLDAAQGKVLKDALDVIGSLTSGTASPAASANTAYTTQGNLALAKGRHLIFAGIEWPQNDTGRRTIVFTASNTSSTAIDSPMSVSRVNATAGTGTIQHLAFHYNATSATTIYLRSWQNSGGSLTPSSVKLYAIRLE